MIGSPKDIRCGLPQESPVSPILFMIYIPPLFKQHGLKESFGYADDASILASFPSLEENSMKIAEADNKAWGSIEGMIFDPGKSELMHFSRKRKDKEKNPQIHTNSFTIAKNMSRPYLKWLGVHFDKKLTFKQHASIQSVKALKVAKALSFLGNTSRGAPARLS